MHGRLCSQRKRGSEHLSRAARGASVVALAKTPMNHSDSILACFARSAVSALRAEGVDPAPVLVAAGFAPDAFRDPNARYSAAATARLWQLAARRSGHPAFGIVVTRHIGSTSLHALGYAILASDTVGEALERAARYSGLIVEPGALVLKQSGDIAALAIRLCSRCASAAIELRDAVLSALVRMLRHASEGAFALLRAELHRNLNDLSPYRHFFRCPVVLGPEDVLYFDRALLAMPLSSANAELARVNEEAIREYLSGQREHGLVERVRTVIGERLPTLVTPELVASRLGVSLRSLQRSLHSHGTSYEELLREVRLELARMHLREGRRSISEIGLSLGYDSSSAFSRAFRRWTGMPPGEYLKRRSP